MNEKLQEALAEILNSVLTAKDFLISELPDVINQLLIWKFWESIIHFTLPLGFLSLSICICLLNIKGIKESLDKPFPTSGGFAFIAGGITSFFLFVISLVVCNLDWLQIKLAPKVYLIEYAANLSK